MICPDITFKSFLMEPKSISASLWMINYFPSCNASVIDGIRPASHCSLATPMKSVWTKCIACRMWNSMWKKKKTLLRFVCGKGLAKKKIMHRPKSRLDALSSVKTVKRGRGSASPYMVVKFHLLNLALVEIELSSNGLDTYWSVTMNRKFFQYL